MAYYFGIDTSNYTTSAAVYDTDTRAVTQVKKPLTVRPVSYTHLVFGALFVFIFLI